MGGFLGKSIGGREGLISAYADKRPGQRGGFHSNQCVWLGDFFEAGHQSGEVLGAFGKTSLNIYRKRAGG